MRIAIEARALPYVQKALIHLEQDRINPPFSSRDERLAFRTEVEGALSEDQLSALKQGDETVLDGILGDDLSQQQQLRLALAYVDHADVDVRAEVRLGLVERLSEIEAQNHVHQDRGPRH